jgi:hypothetical protein
MHFDVHPSLTYGSFFGCSVGHSFLNREVSAYWSYGWWSDFQKSFAGARKDGDSKHVPVRGPTGTVDYLHPSGSQPSWTEWYSTRSSTNRSHNGRGEILKCADEVSITKNGLRTLVFYTASCQELFRCSVLHTRDDRKIPECRWRQKEQLCETQPDKATGCM